MDIWIINHYAIPHDTAGITRHFDFARELVKRRNQVIIFAASFNHRTKKEERLAKGQYFRLEVISGVKFYWIKTTQYHKGNDLRRVANMLSYFFSVVLLGIRRSERPDIILGSSPHPFSGLAGYLLAKIKGAKFIFEVRDLWPQTLVDIGGYSSKSIIVRLLRILEKFLYQHAHKIIILSPHATDYITALGISSDKIAYIPNGIDPELFTNTCIDLPEEIGLLISRLRTEGRFLIGYAGAHGQANALDNIVEAARLLQFQRIPVHFLMVGEGPQKEPMMLKAKEYRLNNISFFKSIPKNAVPAFLKSIDVGVISVRKSSLYKYGTSINKLFDYMASSKPVVWATDSANDSVSEALCGITVPPEIPEEMAKAIMELQSLSSEKREEMGRRGYDYVMKYHAVPVLAIKLADALNQTTHSPR